MGRDNLTGGRPSEPTLPGPVPEIRSPAAGTRSGRWLSSPALLCLLYLALLQPGPALADLTVSRFGDWTLLQGDEGLCHLRYSLHSAQSGALLLDMILRPPDSTDTDPPESAGAMVALLVPRGVSLRDGIAYRHPRRPERAIGLAWQSCDRDLCLAAGPISAAELDRLRRGRFIEVAFMPLPDAMPIRIQVSLRGVTAGWRALAACQAQADAANDGP